MTQSNEPTTDQMNETIAVFMGIKKNDGAVDYFELPDGFQVESASYLEYHTSWEWLMRVIEKIHTLKKHNPDGKGLSLMSQLTVNMELDGYYRKGRCSILGHITHCYTRSIPHNYETVDLPSIFVHGKDTLLEAVYLAVYQFIQWFNQQKRKVIP